MGDHVALLVDHFLTESTLADTIEGRRKSETGHSLLFSPASGIQFNKSSDALNASSAGKLVECRICHEEDEYVHMEVPCSCRGSLKYAHRKCIQRWCDEKGDTNCEICLQQFKPGYTVPPQLFRYGEIPMNFRGRWEVYRREILNSEIITMVASYDSFDSDDEYWSSRSAVFCRSMAIFSMVLFILRHTLPIMVNGSGNAEQDLSTIITMLVFGTFGVIVPVIVVIRTLNAFLHRHQNQGAHGMPVSERQSDTVA